MVLAGVWGSAPKSAAATDIVLDPPLDQFDADNGSVVGWGYNGQGQISIPQSAQSGVTAIAAGASHSLALKSDGSVVGWGATWDGQINIPQSAQSGVTAIAAGGSHSLALKSDGSVVGWGYNGYGQINIPQGLSLWW